MAKRKLVDPIVALKDEIIYAYHTGKIRVVFSREQLASPRHYGEADIDNNTVIINPRHRYGNLVTVVNTLVHEAIHILYDEWLHTRVYQAEKKIAKVLSRYEKQHLLLWALDNGRWRDD